jgi:HlyD family secretion protein
MMPQPFETALPLADSGKGEAPAARASTAAQARSSIAQRARWLRFAQLSALLFAGGVVGLYVQPPALRLFFGASGLQPGAGSAAPIALPAPAAAPLSAPGTLPVYALGRLIPSGDRIRLAPPFGAADARIAALHVVEGDRVAAGALIAELDNLPHLRDAERAAQANLAAADAALMQVRRSVGSAYTEAFANRERAASVATEAAREAARQRDLFDRGLVARAELDQAAAAAEQAARERDRAEAQLARQGGGPQQPDLLLAERQHDVAAAELLRAQGDIAKGEVRAPVASTVLALHARVGEKPDADGIATLGDVSRMLAELEVYQDDIARVAVGQRARLESTALDAPLDGEVVWLGWEVERQSVLAQDPAANTDARIVRVRVALDSDSSLRAARLSGLEVSARLGPAAP